MVHHWGSHRETESWVFLLVRPARKSELYYCVATLVRFLESVSDNAKRRKPYAGIDLCVPKVKLIQVAHDVVTHVTERRFR